MPPATFFENHSTFLHKIKELKFTPANEAYLFLTKHLDSPTFVLHLDSIECKM